jgi:hypothetical protein
VGTLRARQRPRSPRWIRIGLFPSGLLPIGRLGRLVRRWEGIPAGRFLLGLSNQSVQGVESGCFRVNSVAESKTVVAVVMCGLDWLGWVTGRWMLENSMQSSE